MEVFKRMKTQDELRNNDINFNDNYYDNNNHSDNDFIRSQHESSYAKYFRFQYNSVDNVQSEIQLKRELDMSKKIIDNDTANKEEDYSVFSYIEENVEKNIIDIPISFNLYRDCYSTAHKFLEYDMIGRFFILVKHNPFKNYQEYEYLSHTYIVFESSGNKIASYSLIDLLFLSKLQNIEIIEEKIDDEFYLKIPLNIFLECYNGFYPKFLSEYHDFNIIFKNVYKNKDIKMEYSGVNLDFNIKNKIIKNNDMFEFLIQKTKITAHRVYNKLPLYINGLNNFFLIQFIDSNSASYNNILLKDCNIYYKNNAKVITPLFKVHEDMIKKMDIFGDTNYFIPLTYDLTYDEGIKRFFNDPLSNMTGLNTGSNQFYITFNFNCETPKDIWVVITSFAINTFICYERKTGLRFLI